jgi:signal transduction histidine kinase
MFLAQRRHYGRLLNPDTPMMFDDVERRREEEYLRAQHEVTKVLAGAPNPDAAVPLWLKALGSSTGWEAGAFWQRDEAMLMGRRSEWRATANGAHGNDAGRDFLNDSGLPTIAWSREEPHWIEDLDLGEHEASGDRADGGSEFHSALALPVKSSDRTIGVVVFFSGASRSAEPQLIALLSTLCSQLGEYLERMRIEAESERLREEFFALVSHELRSPATSMIGYMDMLREKQDQLDPDGQRALGVMDRNAHRLLRLIGDLLFAAEVEAGSFELESEPVNLEEVITQCVEAAEPRAMEFMVELTPQIYGDLEIVGDADRLGQAIDNLIGNALKFTPEGGHVRVRLARSNGNALIEVEDDGGGIDQHHLDHLFDRFYQAGGNGSTVRQGVGLGLSIVKAIVEGHNGTISVKSRVGGGTTFSILIPLKRAEVETTKIESTA